MRLATVSLPAVHTSKSEESILYGDSDRQCIDTLIQQAKLAYTSNCLSTRIISSPQCSEYTLEWYAVCGRAHQLVHTLAPGLQCSPPADARHLLWLQRTHTCMSTVIISARHRATQILTHSRQHDH